VPEAAQPPHGSPGPGGSVICTASSMTRRAPSAAACCFAMAIGCLANWLKNRSFHCVITGPLFLIAGVAFLLAGVRAIHVNALLVWAFVLFGIGIAFLLEWRYAKRSAS